MFQHLYRYLLRLSTLTVLFLAIASCSTAPATPREQRSLVQASNDAIALALEDDPSFAAVLRQAVGYAVFPTVGKGAIGIGGAYGRGNLFVQGKITGYCDLTQASIGFQLGGQAYTEIIIFKTPTALANFQAGNFQFDAQATAVAIKAGAGANARYTHGVAVFTMDESGLMYEASVGGQKFSFQPLE